MVNEKQSREIMENRVYNVSQVAFLLNRSENYVREMCRRKEMVAIKDKFGYLVTGRAIMAYVEGFSGASFAALVWGARPACPRCVCPSGEK